MAEERKTLSSHLLMGIPKLQLSSEHPSVKKSRTHQRRSSVIKVIMKKPQ